MVSMRAISHSSLALMLAMLVIVVMSFNTLYSARGAGQGETFYACLFAGSLTQVNTSAPPSCGRGTSIEWNAQGVPGERGPQGETGAKGDTGAQGETGPAGADAATQIGGLVGSTGERFSIGTREFESARVGTGHYQVTFPAGTWEPGLFPAAVITPFNPNPTTNLTWGVREFDLDPDGSFRFDVVFDNNEGEPVDAHFIFVVTQS